ncbi:hypothetical protein LINGRAHAP2_LOCUS20377 [Linum grandiflorum]
MTVRSVKIRRNH